MYKKYMTPEKKTEWNAILKHIKEEKDNYDKDDYDKAVVQEERTADANSNEWTIGDDWNIDNKIWKITKNEEKEQASNAFGDILNIVHKKDNNYNIYNGNGIEEERTIEAFNYNDIQGNQSDTLGLNEIALKEEEEEKAKKRIKRDDKEKNTK